IMTTEVPTDSEGNALAGNDTAQRRSAAPLFESSHPSTRLRRAIMRGANRVLEPFAEAVRDRMVEHDEALATLRADLDAARREIAELRRQLDTQRQITALAARIDALEADVGAITTSRPTSNGAHHDG